MNKIKISAVSYLNTKPFLFGIQNSPIYPVIDLSLDTPSECAEKVLNNQADIGLVPVAAMKDIPNAEIISGFCIGAKGAVGSVLLVSETPLNEIENIYLDYQSKTSVELIKIITRKHWKINPAFINGSPGYESSITGTTAGLMIGDRALLNKKKYNYVYDLALAWYELTGLPFVFACWISSKKQDPLFLMQFENALAEGVAGIDKLLSSQQSLAQTFPGVSDYLRNKIQFVLDDEKKKGLALFLSMI